MCLGPSVEGAELVFSFLWVGFPRLAALARTKGRWSSSSVNFGLSSPLKNSGGRPDRRNDTARSFPAKLVCTLRHQQPLGNKSGWPYEKLLQEIEWHDLRLTVHRESAIFLICF